MSSTTVPESRESTAITFEWNLRDVSNIFESSKGEAKSKVTKSPKFGGGRWQILFYANAGIEGGYVSLYLSCEPTIEEKECALDGKWTREGIYKFSFEIRSTSKAVPYNTKEAHSHSFSYKTANWGWAQFTRRDTVYYQAHAVKQLDALLIICTISSSPSAPLPAPVIAHQLVPRDLLDTVGALLDDPTYSDVEFILPRPGKGIKGARRIFAAKQLLRRAEYFKSMFGSGFAESSSFVIGSTNEDQLDASDGVSEIMPAHFEDSDDEDDRTLPDEDDENPSSESEIQMPTPSEASDHSALIDSVLSILPPDSAAEENTGSTTENERQRNVRVTVSHPSSPRSRDLVSANQDTDTSLATSQPASSDGPKKVKVLVKDVAYTTYRAVLYYVYTNTIIFAPLSSSFASSPSKEKLTSRSTPFLGQTASETVNGPGLTGKYPLSDVLTVSSGPSSRREWIKEWIETNPSRQSPCSAKAVYRLADKLDLRGLKERASQHIIKSLNVDNIAYEVFSPFSAVFEDIRKVQVKYFLDHWTDIRSSDAMRNVWHQIRKGRHPGFEEVWPVIAQHLEFKAPAPGADGQDMLAGDF